MRIPLPKTMRHHRERQFERKLASPAVRYGLAGWAFLAARPRLYGLTMALAARFLSIVGGRAGRIRSLPLAGGWTRHRDLPAPAGGTFQQAWSRRGGRRAPSQ